MFHGVQESSGLHQLLCVDKNGYVLSGAVVGIMKDFQQAQGSGNGVTDNGGFGSNDSAATEVLVFQEDCIVEVNWSEIAKLEVIPINCKAISAELHRCKLGSGGRGRCVKYEDKWYTPTEFEIFCGSGPNKTWKRSIKCCGKPLQELITKGIIKPHHPKCLCTICRENEAGTRKVRLFTPYKRQKRNQNVSKIKSSTKKKTKRSLFQIQTEFQCGLLKLKTSEKNNIFSAEDNIISSDVLETTLNDSLEMSTELVEQSRISCSHGQKAPVRNIKDTSATAIMDPSQIMQNMQNVFGTMNKALDDLKNEITDLQDGNVTIKILQKEPNAAKPAVRVQGETNVDDANMEEIHFSSRARPARHNASH